MLLYLMKDPVRLPVPRSLGLIRLDSSDVVRDAGPQLFDQLVGLALDLGAGRGGAMAASPVHFVRLEELLEELVLGGLHQLHQVDGENVLVSLHETVHVVRDHAGIVVDYEAGGGGMLIKIFPHCLTYPGPALLKCLC